jgi:DNA-binding LacI/PurR family transcriptional regulator
MHRMPVFPSLLLGLESAVRAAGLNLIQLSCNEHDPVPDVLAGDQLDGVFLLGKLEALSPAVSQALRTLPVVGMMHDYGDLDAWIDRSIYNNAAIGALAARYLLSRGRRELAFVNARWSHEVFARREHDFVAAVKEAGASLVEATNDDAALAAGAGRVPALDEMLKSRRVTGIFVPTDAHLPWLYRALEEHDLKPGETLDVVSCDNEESFLKQISPRPATIDINLGLVARCAVRQLQWRIDHRDEPNRVTVVVEPVLIPPEHA